MPGDESRIFRDCFNLLKQQIEAQNWIAINEQVHDIIHRYPKDSDDQFLAAELVSVIVNHLDRKRKKDGTKTV